MPTQPFTYQPPTQPYTGSIAQLMLAPGQIQAAAAENIAQARARAVEQSGQVWGQAVQGVAQTVAQPFQLAASPEYQAAKLGLAKQQHDWQGMQLYNQLAQQHPGDWDAIATGLSQGGHADMAGQVAANAATIQEARTKAASEKLDLYGKQRDIVSQLAGNAADAIEKGVTPQAALSQFYAGLTDPHGLALSPDDAIKLVSPAMEKLHTWQVTNASLSPEQQAGQLSTILRSSMTPAAQKSYADLETSQANATIAKLKAQFMQGVNTQDPNAGLGGINAEIDRALPPTDPRYTALNTQAKAGVAASFKMGDWNGAQTVLQNALKQGGSIAGKGTEAVRIQVDGKQVYGNRDPLTGHITYQGKDVTNQAVQTPPVQVQIQGQIGSALSHLPAWASDASTPSGTASNVVDPSLGLSPNGLYAFARQTLAEGRLPYIRGSQEQVSLMQTAVMNKIGAMAQAMGMTTDQFMAAYKANAASLAQQQKYADAASAFLATADKNAAQLQQVLPKIGDTGSPIFNKPLRAFEKDASGNTALSQFATYLTSVQNEYGKILNNPNLAGQLTDSARHEAQALIDPKATVPQILASIQALNTEGGNRLQSIDDQLQRIMGRMKTGQVGAGSGPSSGAPPVGTKRVINGQPAVWDGRGWLPDKGGTP